VSKCVTGSCYITEVDIVSSVCSDSLAISLSQLTCKLCEMGSKIEERD
jgi:hypothetical protein